MPIIEDGWHRKCPGHCATWGRRRTTLAGLPEVVLSEHIIFTQLETMSVIAGACTDRFTGPSYRGGGSRDKGAQGAEELHNNELEESRPPFGFPNLWGRKRSTPNHVRSGHDSGHEVEAGAVNLTSGLLEQRSRASQKERWILWKTRAAWRCHPRRSGLASKYSWSPMTCGRRRRVMCF